MSSLSCKLLPIIAKSSGLCPPTRVKTDIWVLLYLFWFCHWSCFLPIKKICFILLLLLLCLLPAIPGCLSPEVANTFHLLFNSKWSVVAPGLLYCNCLAAAPLGSVVRGWWYVCCVSVIKTATLLHPQSGEWDKSFEVLRQESHASFPK